MLDIDFAEPAHNTCACCGQQTTQLTRFAARAGRLVAAYYLTFTSNHDNGWVYGLAGLGDWSEDGDAAKKRVAIAFTLAPDENDGTRVTIIDAAASPWPSPTELGRPLLRAEALSHPLLPAVYALTDEMVTRDPALMAYLKAA